MPAPVALSHILDAMAIQSDEMSAYLHRPTGRGIIMSDEAIHAVPHHGPPRRADVHLRLRCCRSAQAPRWRDEPSRLALDRTAVVIDVREAEAYRGGTLWGARNVSRNGVLEGRARTF
jgi:hypothetical protein